MAAMLATRNTANAAQPAVESYREYIVKIRKHLPPNLQNKALASCPNAFGCERCFKNQNIIV